MTEEQRPFSSPEDLGESQAEDAAKVSAPGGPSGTGKGGYREIANEAEYEYHLKHKKNPGVGEDNPYEPDVLSEPRPVEPTPEEIVSNKEFRQAVEGLQQERHKRHQRERKKSA